MKIYKTILASLCLTGIILTGAYYSNAVIKIDDTKPVVRISDRSSGKIIINFRCGDSFGYNGERYGTVEGQNETCWMDRNLGASQVATVYNDSAAYGDLFQWGRLDDNHQDRTSGTTAINSGIDNPGHDDFILEPDSPYDWRVPQNNNLWQGVSGINNPCPSGWRIPTEAELEAERVSWGSNDYDGAYASSLKFTVAGYRHRSNGSLFHVGSLGYYWGSTVSGAYARHLGFSSSDAHLSNYARANGFSVRCLKD